LAVVERLLPPQKQYVGKKKKSKMLRDKKEYFFPQRDEKGSGCQLFGMRTFFLLDWGG
jgi:hypothetical protein